MSKNKKKSNLLLRVLSTLILLPLVVFLLYERGTDGIYIRWLLMFGAFMMGYEFSRLANFEKAAKSIFTAGIIAIIWWLFAINFSQGFVDAIKVVFIIGLTMTASGFILKHAPLEWAGLGLVYIGVPVFAAAWIAVQDIFDLWLLWIFAIIWATDIGAYIVGKSFGGKKLVPKISPNKTWSGFFGGVLFAAGVSAIMIYFFELGSLLYLVIAAAALSVWAQLGDILESVIKRHFNVKDSGYLIPGHGGILDRADGLLFAVPVVALALGVLK